MAITKVRLPNQIQVSNDVDCSGYKIRNLSSPVLPQDAATKVYVDNAIQGLDVKQSVKVATTADITTSGLLTIDGITVVSGDRVLVKNQASPIQNGIWMASDSAWTRSLDMPDNSNSAGVFVFVEQGTINGDTGWICVTDGSSARVGADPITFVQFSSAGVTSASGGLTKVGNDIQIALSAGDSTGFLKKTGEHTWTLTNESYSLSSHNHTLDSLSNVSITSIANGEILKWDDTASKWINNTLAEAGIAAASHVHSAADLTSGTIAAGARLGSGNSGFLKYSATTPTWSALVEADIPSLSWAKITSGKPTTLSGYGITDAQPLDPDLTNIAGLAGTVGYLRKTAANTWELRNDSYSLSSHTHLYAGSASAGGPASSVANALTITTGNGLSGTVGSYNGSAAVTISHLGTDGNMHVPATSTTNAGKALIAGSSAGSFGWQTLNMSYLPDAVFKKSVKAASTANIASLSGLMTIDGISLVAGDRVLIKNQTTTSLNGIYVVADGEWPRAADADSSSEIAGAVVNVDSGTVNGGKLFTNTFKIKDTVGTTAMLWDQITTDISQTQKTFFAAPNGANGRPTFRTIVASDIPILNQNTTGAAGSITGQTTVGINLVKLANPSAVTFLRINADNTVSTLNAATFRTAIGAGTVTSVSIANANGFDGTVTTPSTTPAITLKTTVTGMLKGNGTAISAATVNTDYLAPGSMVMNENLTVTAGVGTLANNAKAATIQVYVNGIRQNPGASNDYIVGGTGNKTITFNAGNVPEASDIIVVDYIKA